MLDHREVCLAKGVDDRGQLDEALAQACRAQALMLGALFLANGGRQARVQLRRSKAVRVGIERGRGGPREQGTGGSPRARKAGGDLRVRALAPDRAKIAVEILARDRRWSVPGDRHGHDADAHDPTQHHRHPSSTGRHRRPQLGQHGRHVGPAILRRRRQATQQRLSHALWRSRPPRCGSNSALDDRSDQLRDRRCRRIEIELEWPLAVQHFIRGDAEAELIGARTERLASKLFGAHVERGAHDGPRGRQIEIADRGSQLGRRAGRGAQRR
ncbi:MAG: hypothetical protein NT062_13530 [Proteobacteria bacterium]|nr:hypothetical protein [Pseudomonadota bacterium]